MTEDQNSSAGRPTLYKPEYCEELVKFMSQGYSLASFGADIRVSKTVLYDWIKRHPEFAEAHKIGYQAALKFFETMLISCSRGVIPKQLKDQGSKKLDITAIIFALKTRFHKEYGEKQELIHSGGASPVQIVLPDNGKSASVKDEEPSEES